VGYFPPLRAGNPAAWSSVTSGMEFGPEVRAGTGTVVIFPSVVTLPEGSQDGFIP
jgi:hypothetical protein